MTAFDTNVLIYACDRADPERQLKAINLIAATPDGVLPWQVACEFIAASRKLAPQGFTAEDAWNRLSEFVELFPLVLSNQDTLAEVRRLHLVKGWSGCHHSGGLRHKMVSLSYIQKTCRVTKRPDT
jgi:predicted nucleic acid-binding protein